jgi:hypothetical protein
LTAEGAQFVRQRVRANAGDGGSTLFLILKMEASKRRRDSGQNVEAL